MKTREEQRHDFICAALTGLCANTTSGIPGSAIAMSAVSFANAVLTHLGGADRTAPKPEAPSPDADGWIEHRPGDPPPSYKGKIKVTFHCNDVDSGSVNNFDWSAHDSDSKNPEYAIIARKPA